MGGQSIQTYQELYERVAEVERVKGELRALNPGSQKRKWDDRSVSSDSVAQKRTAAGPAKIRPMASTEPCAKCGRTNHTTAECRIGTNKCMWCGSPNHSTVTCPRRQRAVEKGVVRPIQPPRQETPPPKPSTAGRAYIMSKTEAAVSGMIITKVPFLFKSFFCFI